MSKRFSVTYYPFPTKDPKTGKLGEIFRPTVPIQISLGGKRGFLFQALVDSGSDRNLFPAKLGEQIGINVKDGLSYKIEGIGRHTMTAYTHKIGLHISGLDFETEADFSYEHEIPLLGRSGFFDLFRRIDFKQKRRTIDFKL